MGDFEYSSDEWKDEDSETESQLELISHVPGKLIPHLTAALNVENYNQLLTTPSRSYVTILERGNKGRENTEIKWNNLIPRGRNKGLGLPPILGKPGMKPGQDSEVKDVKQALELFFRSLWLT